MTSSTQKDLDYTKILINVSGQPPDIVGFSNVSWVYGGGVWFGWLLLSIASWHQLLKNRIGSRVDAYIWTCLLYTNWAAIDLSWHLKRFKTLKDSGVDEYKLDGASIAAPLVVLYWASTQFAVQLPFIWFYTDKSNRPRRMALLGYGMVLPTAALISVRYFLSLGDWIAGNYTDADIKFIPALYWPDMAASFSLLIFLPYLGYALFATFLFFLYTTNRQFFNRVFWSRLPLRYQNGIPIEVMISIQILSILSVFAAWFYPVFRIICSPILILDFVFLGPILLLLAVWLLNILVPPWYILTAYIIRSTSSSQPCFFMPCAPRSVFAPEQVIFLLVGLLAFSIELSKNR